MALPIPLPSLGFSTTRIQEADSGPINFGANNFNPFSRSGPEPLNLVIIGGVAVLITFLVLR